MGEKEYCGKGGECPAAERQNGDMTAETHQFWARDHTMTAKTIIDSSRSLQESFSGEVDKERAEQINDMNPEG